MSSEPGWPEETMFERRLLASARGDRPPHDVTGAWTRFTVRLGLVLPAPGADLGGAPAHFAAIGARASRRAAVKWLLLGAFGGGGVTAGVMVERRAPALERPAAQPPEPAAAQAGEAAPPATMEERPPSKAAHRATAHRPTRAGVRAHRAVEPSRLAAEVSRIDIARTASTNGDFDGAIRLIERYHDDFPEGALAPDADVVALEAAVGKHDRGEVSRRARSFLARYPNDPHAARVRWLAEHPLGR